MALNQSIKDKLKDVFRLKGILLVCLMSVTIAVCEAKETTGRGCRNLAKVNDIDELLFQFYSNINDQCLFEMPTEELEKIWGIRVLDYINRSPDEKDTLNGELHRIRKNEEGFFVQKTDSEQSIPAFRIRLTAKRAETEGWGGSVEQGQFPKLLPFPYIINKPIYYIDFDDLLCKKPTVTIVPKNVIYRKHSKYYWINELQYEKQPILLFETGIYYHPMNMVLYSETRILKFKLDLMFK